MIDVQKLTPGTEVVHIKTGEITTVLRGSYEESELGWMIKTSKFPGGYPAPEFALESDLKVEAKAVEVQPITFEIAIIEKEEPVKLTVALVTDKLKPLYDLKIDNYLDEKGYEEVKKGKNKAVKARTSIKKKEDEVIGAIKARHATELSQVTDYTAELYKVCLDAQNDLQGKLDKADKERTAEANRLAEEKKAKTETRNTKMFELGMKFNGKAFMEYGKYIDQEVLHAMADDKYADLLVEIEGLQMEQGVTGKEAEARIAVPSGALSKQPEPPYHGTTYTGAGISGYKLTEPVTKREFPAAVYEREIPGTELRVVITKGTIDADGSVLIANDQILQSAYYVNIVK